MQARPRAVAQANAECPIRWPPNRTPGETAQMWAPIPAASPMLSRVYAIAARLENSRSFLNARTCSHVRKSDSPALEKYLEQAKLIRRHTDPRLDGFGATKQFPRSAFRNARARRTLMGQDNGHARFVSCPNPASPTTGHPKPA